MITVTAYRYVSTNLLTGQVLHDDLPLQVQTFSMQLNGSGTLSGALTLDQRPQVNAPAVAALTPRRSVLWVLADEYPVWCGVVWDWPDMSRQNGTLQISAQTLDSLWSHRIITDTLEYPQVDLFTVFTDLVRYGLSKNSPYIQQGVSPAATRNPAYLRQFSASAAVARFSIPDPGLSGVQWTASYAYSDRTQVSSAWQDMATSGNLEYAFVPGFDANGHMVCNLRLAYTALGRPLAETGIVLSYPGNLLDYGWQVTGSQSSNMIWGTAPPNGSQLQWESAWPHGADLADMADGFPIMESTASWQGSYVTQQSQIDGYADGEVALLTAGMHTPTVNVAGGAYPRFQDLQLGDGVSLALTSPLHPPDPVTGAPGIQQEMRITGITVYPPGPQQSEYMQLTLSGVVAA